MIIYETKSFVLEAPQKPHVDRDDGGHIKISHKKRHLVSDRQDLSSKEAIELMRLTVVAGAAMREVMNERGVDIGRINYQDNGNWGVFKPEGPHFHMHLYGRAKSAKIHKYGQACYFPRREENPEYYEEFKPLTTKDVEQIKNRIDELFSEERFSDANWNL